jgi:PPOX class probable F420-dependent enzyme
MLTTPGKGHTTILTSFRRNGTGVASPVGTVASDGKLYFMTPANAWKVKRLANNRRVTVSPGTFKGEALGPAIEGTARRLTGSEFKRARDLLRVGVVGHFWGIIFDLRYPGEKTAVYEISLVAEGVDHEMTASARAIRCPREQEKLVTWQKHIVSMHLCA